MVGGEVVHVLLHVHLQSTFLADGHGFKRKSPLALCERKKEMTHTVALLASR